MQEQVPFRDPRDSCSRSQRERSLRIVGESLQSWGFQNPAAALEDVLHSDERLPDRKQRWAL
eukprot:5772003-Alexandrium_andersonii.AAC.1